MIQLRLTDKTRKEFGISPSSLVDPIQCDEGLGAWALNVFKVGPQKALIFVNELTLYSFILFGLRKDNAFDLQRVFLKGFIQLLDADGFTEREISFLTLGTEEIQFTKTWSKSVLGNVNDLVWHYESWVQDYGGFKNADIGQIISRLNRMPQKNIGWGYSIDKVKAIAAGA